MPIHLNSEPVKYAIIALSFPVWWPFARALWREFNDSLRDEGGIFGSPPSAEELRRIERERGRFHSTLTSVTWAEHEREQNLEHERPRAQRGARPAPRRGGFGRR